MTAQIKYLAALALSFMMLYAYSLEAAPDWNNVDYGSGTSQSDGKSLADTVKGYNSGNTMQDMLQGPVMGAGDMTTLGASFQCDSKGSIYEDLAVCNGDCPTECKPVSFDASVDCTKNIEAIVIKPKALIAGGEVILQVNYDTDLNGSLDTTIETPNISGFCVNGVMSCNPGTLNNCGFYEFSVAHKCSKNDKTFTSLNSCLTGCTGGSCTAQTNHVELVKSKQENVGRCDCTNSACGKSFNSTFDSSMAVFGGGIASQTVNSLGLSVSKTNIDLSTLTVSYMAMAAGKCGEGDVNIDKIKAGKSTGTPDYTAELLDAVNDPDSVYNIITSDKTVTEGQCEVINSVVLDGTKLNALRSHDNCQLRGDCRIDKEYACESVCPPNSVYVPALNKCELYNYPAGYFMCPDGFQFGVFDASIRGFRALPSADGANVCFKQLTKNYWDIVRHVLYCNSSSLSGCRRTISVSNRLYMNFPANSIDPDIWPTMTLYSYSYNGPRYTNLNLYPDGARITDWNTHEHEKTATKVNGNSVPVEVYDNGGKTGGILIYRTIPHTLNTNEDNNVQFHLNQTDWPGSDNINVTTYLSVTTTIRQKQCPAGWYLMNGKCYQEAKPLSALKCDEIKRDFKENQFCAYAANSFAYVCGDGTAFYSYDVIGNSSTSAGSGRFVTKKRYACTESKQEFDYSDITDARKDMKLTETGGGYIFSYTDESGAVRTFDFDGQYNESGCQKSCRVVSLDSTSSTQVTSQQKPVTSSDNFASRLCIDNACPYDPAAEKVLQDCKCTQTDDFGKVISILGVLEESTKDKICVQ